MNGAAHGAKALLVIASNGFQHVEYKETKHELEKRGIVVVTTSDRAGGAVAHDKSTTHVDIILDKVDMHHYDGIFLIGGPGALEHLDHSHVYHLIKQAQDLGKAYGAICISVRILAKIGALQGKHATGWDGDKALRGILEGYGAIYKSDKHIVTDGLVVTATGPDAAKSFGDGIARVLTKEKLG